LHIEPTWSPDGKEIIFLSNHGIPLGSGALWRMPAEPGGMAKAKMVRREETLYRTRPDWSPDGTRIIYSSHQGGQFDNLFVLPASGGEPYKMTFGEWDHFCPRWSPDGQRVTYVSNQHGLTDLRILEAFGGKETKVEITDKRYHLYANPVGNDMLKTAQTTVRFTSKLEGDAKVEYPAGKLVKDETVGDYKTYEGTVTIKAKVRRVKGDTSPLALSITFQACDEKTCLLRSTVKKTAE